MSAAPIDVNPELERTMLVFTMREDEGERRYAFSRHTLAIGAERPTLILGPDPGFVVKFPRVIELVEVDGQLLLGRTRSPDVEVEGVLTGPPRPKPFHHHLDLMRGSVVRSGTAALTIEAFAPMVPPDFENSEGEFAKMVAADASDLSARLIYADALEESGYLVRAEFLRVEIRLLTGDVVDGDAEARERLYRKLTAAKRWRDYVGAPAIATRCPLQAGRACPVAWGQTGERARCFKCERAVPFRCAPRA